MMTDAALMDAVGEIDAMRSRRSRLPGCVARALLGADRCVVRGVALGALTVEGWMHLEAEALLLPWIPLPEDADGRMEALRLGLRVLAGARDADAVIADLGEAAAEVLRAIRGRVAEAFGTHIEMREAGCLGAGTPRDDTAGFGEAGVIVVALMSVLHVPEATARRMCVSRALYLLAAEKWRCGWVPMGGFFGGKNL